ncbi:MAG: hemerythrin domain-containing protein [Planctomycetes bacterium]|nr:hemerythrin domain-containing protein [Planctomycetota bacterium]
MPDIIALLKADHKEVKDLLTKLTADEEPSDCDALFAKLYASLQLHARFEEEEVYPLLKEDEETKDIALEAYEEHQQVKTLLEALNAMDDEDETCNAKMNVLSEDLLHHIKEEEGTLFPKLKKAVDAETLQKLGESYQQAKAETESSEDQDEESGDAARGKKPAAKSHKAGRSH